MVGHLRQQAYLVKGLKINIIDARDIDITKSPTKQKLEDVFWFSELELEAPSHSFYFEGGLVSLVKFTMRQKAIQNTIFI